MKPTPPSTKFLTVPAQLAEIAPLLDDGTIRIVIDSSFPLAKARQAHEHAAKGNLQGKIALTVD
ncbi:zinc-binding dehydrogenase [Nitrospirillum sp. BR 11828]|uniref:zinc-binding dehydrogenase n=1 Tax=Nitrospirillum sp. BR 11828 TaxID=3104325 RepID=UPI002AC9F911|nr:zinc-binding dehydrogenase [Nitrospirillum sp. BR 11828]MDZ5650030.1 zinc-binding dehydrogenase [Nitrospirillum sp. BR 11828]